MSDSQFRAMITMDRARGYALSIPENSLIASLAISVCRVHDIHPHGYHNMGMENWRYEIFTASMRDALRQSMDAN